MADRNGLGNNLEYSRRQSRFLQCVRLYESYELNWAQEKEQALKSDWHSFDIYKSSRQPHSPTEAKYYKVLHISAFVVFADGEKR